MRRAALVLALLMAGCAATVHRPGPLGAGKPAVAVTAPAKPVCVIPPIPAYPDTSEALAAAPGLVGRDLLLKAGKDARDAYERRVIEAKRTCR